MYVEKIQKIASYMSNDDEKIAMLTQLMTVSKFAASTMDYGIGNSMKEIEKDKRADEFNPIDYFDPDDDADYQGYTPDIEGIKMDKADFAQRVQDLQDGSLRAATKLGSSLNSLNKFCKAIDVEPFYAKGTNIFDFTKKFSNELIQYAYEKDPEYAKRIEKVVEDNVFENQREGYDEIIEKYEQKAAQVVAGNEKSVYAKMLGMKDKADRSDAQDYKLEEPGMWDKNT